MAAQAEARRLAEEHGWSPKEQNAFQHAYWMASMRVFGLTEHQARMFAVAHELDHQFELDENGQPGDPIPYGSGESRRDMHNNNVGLTIARVLVDKNDQNLSREYLYVETIPDAIVSAMNQVTCGDICLAI